MKIQQTDQHYFGRDLEAMSFAVNYHRWIIERLGPHLGKRLLEVGAGSGNFTELLLEHGVESIHALEPSANMYRLLETHFSAEPRVTSEQAFFTDVAAALGPQFDSALYINVLEHVEHDEEELRAVLQALKPGGCVCIYVPALPWLYAKFDESIGHYRRYTKAGLTALLERAGFQPVNVRYCDMPGIPVWYVIFVLMKQTLLGGHVSLYDRFVFPLTGAIEKWITPPIGKNLLAVARKPAAGS
jgi:SAM-dependent methyltransferase